MYMAALVNRGGLNIALFVTILGFGACETASGQTGAAFELSPAPLKEYFFTSMNGYTFYVEPDHFFETMPKVLFYADVDSTRKRAMLLELQALEQDRPNCGNKLHKQMTGDWRPVFERLVAQSLQNGKMIHIANERSGAIVSTIWSVKKLRSSHGPGKYKYYADAKHRKLVFTLQVHRGGRPLSNF